MPSISVVIRAFNEDRHIGRLLDGIARQHLPEGWTHEVILVDSGSTDSTVAIAERMGARILHIPKEHFSFGRALNLGCNEAVGDILLFASAHVYPVYKDWVENMIRPFNDLDVGLVYGRQIGNENTRFSEHIIFARWFPRQSNYNQSTPFCNNANCAIRKSLWFGQPFDESLTGLEDLDWANRIMLKKYKIIYVAEAAIVHVHEETATKIRNRYQREAIALKRIMPNVHFNLWDFIRLFSINIVSDCYQAFKKRILIREIRGIVLFRLMQFYGTYVGHNQSGDVSKELKARFYYPETPQIKSGENEMSHDNRRSKKIEYL
jgi:glycosyltransferase involved in cell wall biosynthesis